MALDIVTSKQFKKDMKLYKRNEKVRKELDKIIKLLSNNQPLPVEKRDHGLSGELKEFRDCHIFPNIVLLYRIKENEIYLARIGSHNKLEITESFIKLRIKEDTACIASKTSYMNEDGLDANGIYYFGKKPQKPLNWKEYKPKKLKIKE